MNLKNITFAIGLSWLIYGALYFQYPDWDIPVSLLMAALTYMSADWVMMAIRMRNYRRWPLALFFIWLSVDGVYWAYWHMTDPSVMIRDGQWPMSLCLYLLCGILWTADLPALRRYRTGPARAATGTAASGPD